MVTTCVLYAQNKEFLKITNILQKELTGKQFLGGMYDPPCYNIESISVLENGEISIVGSDQGCTKTFLIKDAQITLNNVKVKIYQADPEINITFYTENADKVYETLMELKDILLSALTYSQVKSSKAAISDDHGIETITIDDIIDRHIEAEGGAKKIQSIRSTITEGVIQINGNQIPFKSWAVHNLGMRLDMEIQGKVNITATTPYRSWTLYPAQKQRKPVNADAAVAKESAEELDLTGDLFDYKVKGNTAELIGKEVMDGKETYKIKLTRKSGTIVYLYLDAKTFLLSKRILNKIVEGKVTELTENRSSYRKNAEGYIYASSYQLLPAGLTVSYTSFHVNETIDPQIFVKP
jgi:hypothetical protein